MVNCPYCGKLTDPKLENCPHCGGYLMKGLAPFVKPPSERAPHQTCPNCHALVKEGDIICVACGTNLLTGEKIAEEGKAARPPRDHRRLLYLLGGVGAVVLVVALVFAAVFVFSRDPVQKAAKQALSGNLLEASNTLNAHLQNHPDDAKGQFLLGKVLWKMNQFQQASEAFERAANVNPQNTDAAMLAVVSAGTSGAPGTRERQIAQLRNITSRAADNQDAWLLLALLLGASNDIPGQIEALKNAAEASPSVHQARGIAMALQGNARDAKQEFLTAAETEGEGGDMAAVLGFADCIAGDLQSGEQRLKQALNSGATAQRAIILRLGLLLVSQNRFEEAEQYLAQVAAEDATAQFYHAVCLQARGMTAEALREFNMVAQQPKSAFAGEASLRAAEMNLAQGNAAGARDLVEKALTAGGNSAALHVLRGRAMVLTNEDDEARKSLKRAVELEPDYAPAYLESALLYIKKQLFADAIKDLEKYISLAPPEAPGTRVDEVKMLLDQLRQASGSTGDTRTTTGRTM